MNDNFLFNNAKFNKSTETNSRNASGSIRNLKRSKKAVQFYIEGKQIPGDLR